MLRSRAGSLFRARPRPAHSRGEELLPGAAPSAHGAPCTGVPASVLRVGRAYRKSHVAQAGSGLVIGRLAAAEDGHAVLFALAGTHPQTKAGKVGGDGGDGVGGAFLRCIAPGFIPGGEHARIAGRGQHLVITHVQEAVLAVELGQGRR